MTSQSFQRLEVPRDWTAEQDIGVFVARFGEADDYFGEALARVDEGYAQLEQSLDRALFRIGRSAISQAHIIHRLDAVRRYLSPNPSREAGGGRLRTRLAFARFALVEYFRLVPCYLHNGDRNWLAPLVRLSDCLNRAALMLSEVIP